MLPAQTIANTRRELEKDLLQGRLASWNLYPCQNPRSNPSPASPSERV